MNTNAKLDLWLKSTQKFGNDNVARFAPVARQGTLPQYELC